MRILAFLAILVSTPAAAVQVTVDFDNISVGGELQILPGGIFQGIHIYESPTVGALHLIDDGDCSVGCAASGSNSLLFEGIHYGGQPPLALVHPAGHAFELLSFAAGEAFPRFGGLHDNAVGIGLVGTLSAGGTLTAFVGLDGILDGPGGVADFQNVAAPFGNAQLVRIELWGLYEPGVIPTADPSLVERRAGFSIDTITFEVFGDHIDYTALPEPATMMLLVCAILSLSMRARL